MERGGACHYLYINIHKHLAQYHASITRMDYCYIYIELRDMSFCVLSDLLVVVGIRYIVCINFLSYAHLPV